jgi:hypothetical protein
MDATRRSRSRDAARTSWYAKFRQARFAFRHGFLPLNSSDIPAFLMQSTQGSTTCASPNSMSAGRSAG